MTSHELRNPLSAILQCADLALTFLQKLSSNRLNRCSNVPNSVEVFAKVSACIESLRTIISCSLHQKRIIDDVLTLSKLDSDLIVITPVRVQPSLVVSDAMKMFEIECSQTDISLNFQEDETFQGMEWAMLDPSRLLQILINLLYAILYRVQGIPSLTSCCTNAIKFTKGRPQRRITVTLGGSWSRPPKCWQEIKFILEKMEEPDIFQKAEWGSGTKIYLWLKVTDTGCGMTEEEQKKLFGRFSQATPRTHIKYGGSGLGLYISKSLSILQGGGIGAKSERGVGSTIAFYIGARLAEPPALQRYGKIHSTADLKSTFQEAMKKVKLNVLIVEDNLVNQKILRKHLQMLGWNVSVAGNGQEALDWLKDSVYWRADEDEEHEEASLVADANDQGNAKRKSKHELDIILMDIEMPIMDGLACTRRIREHEHAGLLAHPYTPKAQNDSPNSNSPISPIKSSEYSFQPPSPKPPLKLPILAVSANARSEQIALSLAAGCSDSISKPFQIHELWPKICILVERVGRDADPGKKAED